MNPVFALRFCAQELRGSWGRVVYWLLCLAIGVGAVVSIAGLASSLDGAIRSKAKELLAADLAISSRQPLPAAAETAVAALPGAVSAEVRELATVVARLPRAPAVDAAPAPRKRRTANSQLVELKAVRGPYPLYGKLETEPPLGADGRIDQVLGDHSALVGEELLARLDLAVGDRLRLGRTELVIAGVLVSEPDRLPSGLVFGPRVLVSIDALERSQLLEVGSLGRFVTLVKLPGSPTAEDAQLAASVVKKAIGDNPFVRVQSYVDAQPGLRRDLERLEGYLSLVALLSLLIGGVGVAQGVRAWIATRIDSLAILKCLGVRPRELFGLYLFQSVGLGLVGSAAGGILGLAALRLVPFILNGLIPPEAIDTFQPAALLRGMAIGVGIAATFSLPPLLAVLRVSPARVFRRNAEPLPSSRWLPATVMVLVIAVVATIAALESRSFTLGLLFTAAVLGTALALAASAFALARVAGRLARLRGPFWLRSGLGSLARPGSGLLGAMTALGLGLLVLLTMSLVQGHLEGRLQARLPANAPSAFLVDIRPEQWVELQEILDRLGGERVDSVPVVRGRLAEVAGRPVSELIAADPHRWALRREQRLTFLDHLPSDNQILEGALWSDPLRDEVSIEQEFAREIEVGLGDTIALDIRDERFELLVTSIRHVDWESFGINFFLIAEPAALERVAYTRLAAVKLPEEREQEIQDAIVERFPNVLPIRIRQILDKVLDLLRRLTLGVHVLGLFVVVASLVILFGAIAASSAQRGREVALYKTLGMTRFDVLRVFATEYALLGLVSAVVACATGTTLAWWVVTRSFEIDWTWRPGTLVAVLAGGAALAVVAGLLASAGALRRPPADVFRQG